MRRILSKEQEEKRQKRNGRILVLFLVIILLGSSFGIIVNSFDNSNSSTKMNYNGKELVYQNGFWIYDAGDYQLGFVYNPEESENVSGQIYTDLTSSVTAYQNAPVYIYSEEPSAEAEVYRNIYPFVQRIQKACIEGKECGEDIPVKNCSDRLIVIESSELTEIVQNDKCVYIHGSEEDLVKLSDEFLYKIFGIK